jgi:hypothetical protein
MLGAMDLGIADDRQRADHKQTAQVAVALFADAAESFPTPAQMLLRHQADPGREISSRSESLRISDAGDQGGSERRTDARKLIQPLAHLVGPVPGHDQAIKLQYPRLEHLQLGAKRRNTGTCDIGQPFVVAITGDLEQLLNTSAPDRGDDAELGKVSSDRIDDGRLLPNEQMACAME